MLGELVTQDPGTWAADPAQVATAAARPALQAAYFNSLHQAVHSGTLASDRMGPLAEAAFAVRPGAGAPGAEPLQLVMCNLLHRAWDSGLRLEEIEAEAVVWLHALITGWSVPRQDTSWPLGAATTAPGGSALLSLLTWGIQHAVPARGCRSG
ncbi:hypothetical protein AB0D86_49480 [Streptomyces sp. NPDC048324]|uniref:hypothetical protein n=1 Tax=Streptomyces sp. NPDC048324 TaxID=3157205 RepID=UPI00344228CC